MGLEQLKKHVHPDFTPLSTMQTWAWYTLILIPFVIFSVSSGYALWNYFTSPDVKSIGVSNVGFAMFIGLASVCFSYFKILEGGKFKRLHLDIQRSGEFFLIAAIGFIVSSALKYSWSVSPHSTLWLDWLLRLFCKITYGLAELTCILGLGRLIDVLHIRIIGKSLPAGKSNNKSTSS